MPTLAQLSLRRPRRAECVRRYQDVGRAAFLLSYETRGFTLAGTRTLPNILIFSILSPAYAAVIDAVTDVLGMDNYGRRRNATDCRRLAGRCVSVRRTTSSIIPYIRIFVA